MNCPQWPFCWSFPRGQAVFPKTSRGCQRVRRVRQASSRPQGLGVRSEWGRFREVLLSLWVAVDHQHQLHASCWHRCPLRSRGSSLGWWRWRWWRWGELTSCLAAVGSLSGAPQGPPRAGCGPGLVSMRESRVVSCCCRVGLLLSMGRWGWGVGSTQSSPWGFCGRERGWFRVTTGSTLRHDYTRQQIGSEALLFSRSVFYVCM